MAGPYQLFNWLFSGASAPQPLPTFQEKYPLPEDNSFVGAGTFLALLGELSQALDVSQQAGRPVFTDTPWTFQDESQKLIQSQYTRVEMPADSADALAGAYMFLIERANRLQAILKGVLEFASSSSLDADLQTSISHTKKHVSAYKSHLIQTYQSKLRVLVDANRRPAQHNDFVRPRPSVFAD